MTAQMPQNPIDRIGLGLSNIFKLDGRARHSDFFFAFILLTVLGMTIGEGLELLVDVGRLSLGDFGSAVGTLLAVMPFVRRLHDQNKSGWYALIILPFVAIKVCERYLFDIGVLPSPELGWPYNAITVVLVVAFWGLALWPGTVGENRFGSDPRATDGLREPDASGG